MTTRTRNATFLLEPPQPDATSLAKNPALHVRLRRGATGLSNFARPWPSQKQVTFLE